MAYVYHKLIGNHAWMVVWISKKQGIASFNSWGQMVVLVGCLSRLPFKAIYLEGYPGWITSRVCFMAKEYSLCNAFDFIWL